MEGKKEIHEPQEACRKKGVSPHVYDEHEQHGTHIDKTFPSFIEPVRLRKNVL